MLLMGSSLGAFIKVVVLDMVMFYPSKTTHVRRYEIQLRVVLRRTRVKVATILKL